MGRREYLIGFYNPVNTPLPNPHAFLVSQHMWHQSLGHPVGEVLRHACQLGKHVKLPFVSSDTVISSCFDIIHSDVWTSPIPSLSGFKYYGPDTAYLLLYVDDIVLTASSESLLQQIIRSLHQEFAMTDAVLPLNYFLVYPVKRDFLGLFLSQKKYVVEILDRAHMVNFLLSISHLTRLDNSYAVQQGYSYFPHPSTTDLVAYSDADWASCPTTRRSTLGYCVFLGNNLLSWSSKRQPTLSCSSAEANYRGVANVVAETCWLRNLLRELHTPLSSATLVYCDNVSAVNLSCNPVQHQRTKHIEIDIHFVCDLVAAGQVRVLHVSSRYQFADIFTKGLPSTLFEEFRTSLSVWCPIAPTAGEF
ncbi:ribonuclease H-like domain-containing protein [Tanacetum coccineum]